MLKAASVVIGSGPGGAITACRLAEAGEDVLVIEEGAEFPDDFCAPFSLEEMAAKYRNRGLTPALGEPPVTYVEACCSGGGSEINSGLYHRPPAAVLAHWRSEFGVQELAESDVAPWSEIVERDLSVSLLPHAAPAASLKLHEGARKLGWSSVEVPRWYKYEGGTGIRQTMSRTYLARARQAGARFLHGQAVTRLRPGWRVEGDGLEVEARKVFVCGGAIQTPALLRRSGIRRNIGNSLHLHPTLKVVARFPERINEPGQGVPVHQVKEFAPELSFGCSISSPEFIALALLDHPQALAEVPRDWPRMAVYYAMTAGESRGSVRGLPGMRDPLVRYAVQERELQTLATGARRLGELLLAAGAEALFFSIAGTEAITSRGELERLPAVLPRARTQLMTIHLFSTCPMGENRARCAADSFGAVHGHENLFLNDASLLCTAPTVNPQGTIMAIAHRNVAHHLHRR